VLNTDTARFSELPHRDASVSPVEKVVLGVEFEIDRLRQMIDQQLDIRADLGLLTRRNFKPGSEDAPLATVRVPAIQ